MPSQKLSGRISRQISQGMAADSGSGLIPRLMVVSFGESNSGGEVANANATSWELSSRPELDNLNIVKGNFQPLDIGTNNNLGHFGLDSTKHAWELGLANIARKGFFGDTQVSLVQTGQGGSRISQWDVGGAYWLAFLNRVNNALARTSTPSQIAVWITFGINDTLQGTTDVAFQTGFLEIIGRIKTALPGCKIYISKLMTNSAQKIAYNTVIDTIDSGDTDIRAVDITGLTTQDTHHWDYASQKRLAQRITKLMALDFVGTGSLTYTGFNGANGEFQATTNTDVAVSTTSIDTTQPFAVVADVPSNNSVVITLSSDNVNRPWGTNVNRVAAWYMFITTNILYGAVGADTAVVHATGVPATAIVRAKKSGNDLLLQYSADGGLTWTLATTLVGVLSGVPNLWVKVQSPGSASGNIFVSIDKRTS